MWERGITNLTPWKDIAKNSDFYAINKELILFILILACAIFVCERFKKR